MIKFSNNGERKKCMAIKDGWTRSVYNNNPLRKFSIRGLVYEYYGPQHGYFLVDTYRDGSLNHRMTEKFFYEYFKPLEEDFLKDEDLMI